MKTRILLQAISMLSVTLVIFCNPVNGQCPSLPIVLGPSSICANSHSYTITNFNAANSYTCSVIGPAGVFYANSVGQNFTPTGWPVLTETEACTLVVAVTANGCTVSSNFFIHGCCGDLNDPNTINDGVSTDISTTGTATGQTYTINGKFTIVAPAFSFINCTLLMGPGASIEVTGNGTIASNTLALFSTNISSCILMWEGNEPPRRKQRGILIDCNLFSSQQAAGN